MRKPLLLAVLCVALGLLAGRYLLPVARTPATAPPPPAGQAAIWTCSMHPQIRVPSPGRCPICGMELIPATGAGSATGEVVLAEAAQRIASIEVTALGRRALAREVRTVGRIELAEPLVAYLTARADGRVERVYADYTGVEVEAGDHMVDLYAPDLIVAQEELLLAAGTPGAEARRDPSLQLELARQKLVLLLGLTEAQIDQLVLSGKPRLVLTVHAPVGGTVMEKHVRPQAYVKAGDPLYTIADLSTVWLYADVYEYELPWVALGQPTSVTVEAVPGETFSGEVAFVEPMVREDTRTVRVRVNVGNPDRRLRPGMFASAVIQARLGKDGKRAAEPVLARFSCRMHPEVRGEAPGACRICGMQLEARAEAPLPQADALVLALPAAAVLDSGPRRIVWVERAPGRYAAAEVQLGPRAGAWYPVLAGLQESDRVVVRGGFLLDSQAQIEGKPSLLFPAGLAGAASGGQHQHR